MDSTKMYIYISILILFLCSIQFTLTECGTIPMGSNEKVIRDSSVKTQSEPGHHSLKRFAIKEKAESILKDTPANTESKKTKRDAAKGSLFLSETFDDYQPDVVEVPFAPVIVLKRQVDEQNNVDYLHKNSGKISTKGTTAEPEKGKEGPVQKLMEDGNVHKMTSAIGIEETLKRFTTTEGTALEENQGFIDRRNTEFEPEKSINVPYLSNIGTSKDKNRDGLLDSEQNAARIKKELKNIIDELKSTSIETKEITSSASPDDNTESFLEKHIEPELPVDDGTDLYINNRLGRNAQPTTKRGRSIMQQKKERSGDKTPPVKYQGKLASSSDVKANTACLTNAEISEVIYGTDIEDDKNNWVLSNENNICDYTKFQSCLDREKPVAGTTTSQPGQDPEEVLSKTYCGCLAPSLILINEICYIPAGTTDASKCPLHLTVPAGNFPAAPDLQPQCAPGSECAQRPGFIGNRCLCKPNIKFNKKKRTCGKDHAHSIFQITRIFNLLLVISTFGTIFVL